MRIRDAQKYEIKFYQKKSREKKYRGTEEGRLVEKGDGSGTRFFGTKSGGDPKKNVEEVGRAKVKER